LKRRRSAIAETTMNVEHPRQASGRSELPRFLAFYMALFAAFGVSSPYLPGLLQQGGLEPGQLGVVLAGGTAIRLVAGPIGGRLADRTGRPRLVLAALTGLAALVALLYAPARGLMLLLAVSVAHAAVLAPLTPVADALATGSSRSGRGFSYGWVRGAGSAAFIGGVLLSGEMVARVGLGVIVWLNAILLAAAACVALLLPNRVAGEGEHDGGRQNGASVSALLRTGPFACLMLIAALIGGSHALHDGFEVIRWSAAGLSARQSSLLWALSVASEVAVFVFIGPPLLRWLGPARAMMLSAVAGILRWGTAAQTAWFPVIAMVQPLHGLTFALLHLACMDMITRLIPRHLAATAQAFYATFAVGTTSAAVTLASGPLYGRYGAGSFWFMAALCVLALPLTVGLRLGEGKPVSVASA
jgi:PPP family 3-phenylpropionic acid transporter